MHYIHCHDATVIFTLMGETGLALPPNALFQLHWSTAEGVGAHHALEKVFIELYTIHIENHVSSCMFPCTSGRELDSPKGPCQVHPGCWSPGIYPYTGLSILPLLALNGTGSHHCNWGFCQGSPQATPHPGKFWYQPLKWSRLLACNAQSPIEVYAVLWQKLRQRAPRVPKYFRGWLRNMPVKGTLEVWNRTSLHREEDTGSLLECLKKARTWQNPFNTLAEPLTQLEKRLPHHAAQGHPRGKRQSDVWFLACLRNWREGWSKFYLWRKKRKANRWLRESAAGRKTERMYTHDSPPPRGC